MTFFPFVECDGEERRSGRETFCIEFDDLEEFAICRICRRESMFIQEDTGLDHRKQLMISFLFDEYFIHFLEFFGRMEESMYECWICTEDDQSATIFV